MKYLLLTLLLSSCWSGSKAIKIDSTNNIEIQVDTLFTKDGCTIYRFIDSNRYHYYTKCGETVTTHNCGKNCKYEENIK